MWQNPEKRCCPLTVRKRPVRSGRRLTDERMVAVGDFLQGDLLEEEARRTVCALSTDTRKKLYSRHRLSIFFASLKSVTEIPGDRLCFQLPDGEYEFAFSIYKSGKEEAQLSMADQGFFHPGCSGFRKEKARSF